MKHTVISPEQMRELIAARDHIKRVADGSDECDYLDMGDALDAMEHAYNAIDWLFTPRKKGKKKKYVAWVTLCKEYEAFDDAEVFYAMLDDIDGRAGMDISSHEIIKQ